mmetsp:Transcript_17671/g.37364  ORF Transcript_17671/g.37364 Transcript_17671/m.37364 type:complete len:324 (-) Transcript_17671:40-1011(-)
MLPRLRHTHILLRRPAAGALTCSASPAAPCCLTTRSPRRGIRLYDNNPGDVPGLANRPPLTPRASPPIRSTEQPLTKVDVSIGDLIRARSYLGFKKRATHPESFRYLLGTLHGNAIIDPEHTLYSLRRVLHFLKKVIFKGGRILFVSSTPQLGRLCRVVGQQTGQFYLPRRWNPGLLTNFESSRVRINTSISLAEMAEKHGTLRGSDVQRSIDYLGIAEMTRLPDVIFRLDSTNLHNEPTLANIPVISVVDTDNQVSGVDYPIPANANSLRFYHTLSHLIVRTVKEAQALRRTLDEYHVKGTGERDAGSGRRGGRARTDRRDS